MGTHTQRELNSGCNKHVFLMKEHICARERPLSVFAQAEDICAITKTHITMYATSIPLIRRPNFARS